MLDSSPAPVAPAPLPSDPKPAASQTTLFDLIRIVLADSTTTPKQKKLLIDELRKNNPVTADRWTYRWCVYFLGGSLAALVLSYPTLLYLGKPLPEGLVPIGTAIVGSLAGLLGGVKSVPKSS